LSFHNSSHSEKLALEREREDHRNKVDQLNTTLAKREADLAAAQKARVELERVWIMTELTK
jgi:hypothetical protein